MSTLAIAELLQRAGQAGLAAGEAYPEAGTYLKNTILQGTIPQATAAFMGMSPEQRAAEVAKLQEENKRIAAGFSKSPIGQAIGVLTGDDAAKQTKPEEPIPTPLPARVTKPQGAAPIQVKQEEKRVFIRQPDGSFLYESPKNLSPEEISAKYAAGIESYQREQGPSGLKAREKALAAEAADKIERTTSPSTGYWPGGVEGRTSGPITVGDTGVGVGDASLAARSAGQEGTFSYMGTPGFSRSGEYTDEQYKNLHPAERAVIDEAEAEVAAREQRKLGLLREKATTEQEMDPVGFRQRQVQQYLAGAREQLGDPESYLHSLYQMNMREWRAKNPKATAEQVNNFALFLQNKLVTDQAEADAIRYGQWVAGQDPRVLSSAARNPLAGLMFGGGGAGGTTP